MTFSIAIMLQKVVKVGIQALVAWIGAETLSKLGITVDVEVMTVGLMAVLEGFRNTLKMKTGWKFL